MRGSSIVIFHMLAKTCASCIGRSKKHMIETRGDYGFKFYEYIYIYTYISVYIHTYTYIYRRLLLLQTCTIVHVYIEKTKNISRKHETYVHRHQNHDPRVIETFHVPSCVRVYILKILIHFYSQKSNRFFTV